MKTWRSKDLQVLVTLDRTGEESEIAFSPDLTALGLVSRLEHALDHFEAELAEHRRAIGDNTRRIADYEPRIGGGFALAAELSAKVADLAELEVSLAATAEQAQSDEDQDRDMPRLRGASCDDEEEDEREAS